MPVDQGEQQLVGQIAQEFALRPGQIHGAKAQFKLCDPLSPLRPRRRDADGALVHDG